MIYEIQWMENKVTKAGKAKINATLIDSDNIVVKDVTIWPDFPDYSEIRPGSKVDGTIDYRVVNGKKWASLHASINANGTYKPKPKTDFVKAAETTSKSVAIAQDKKMEGIKDSSTFRAATDMTLQWRAERLARGESTSAEEWQEEWIAERKWFDARFSEPF